MLAGQASLMLARRLLDVCSMFARSCKRDIRYDVLSVDVVVCNTCIVAKPYVVVGRQVPLDRALAIFLAVNSNHISTCSGLAAVFIGKLVSAAITCAQLYRIILKLVLIVAFDIAASP